MLNSLALPQAHLIIEVANNCDWVDTLVVLIDPPANAPPDAPIEQLDLRGLSFEMHIRRQPRIAEVVLSASTDDGRLRIAPPPNVGYLIFFVGAQTMRTLWPGAYVGDIRVREGLGVRTWMTLDLTIIEGITR